MRTIILLALFLATVCAAEQAQTQPPDEVKIRELIAQHALASERRDLEGLVDLYHSDAEWACLDGTRIVGRPAIEAAYRESTESSAAQSGRHHVHPEESVRIRFLRPDVALVEVESHSVRGKDAQGASLATSKSLLVTVWTKQDGQWGIVYQRGAGTPPR